MPCRDGRLTGAVTGLLLAGSLVLTGCSPAEETSASHADEHATVEHVEGADVARVSLSEPAVRRLGIRTEPVLTAGRSTSVPYAALVYSADGGTWVYAVAGNRVFERQAVVVGRVEGPAVLLAQGPPAGTDVVTTGAAELLGTELDVGH
jgi:hypothetical protein